MAVLTFAPDLRDVPLALDEYQEVFEPRWEWMKGERFFLAHGLLERLEQGGGYCASQVSVSEPTLEICHNLDGCVAGLSETRLMHQLASELELIHWRFEVGCRTVNTWGQGTDSAWLLRHLRDL